MVPRPHHLAAFLLSLGLFIGGCGEDPASPATSTGSGSEGGGGLGPLPALDPEACPVTSDSGLDGALADAALAQWSPDFALPPSGSIVQEKVFPLTVFLGASLPLSQVFESDPTLSAVAADRDARLRSASATCGADVPCLRGALAWGEPDASSTATTLVARLEQTGLLAGLAADLRAGGRFSRWATSTDAELVDAAFRALTAALDGVLETEADALGGAALASVVDSVAASHAAPFPFFEALMAVDLAALAEDDRDEAARYEPLDEGENAAALAHVPAIDWAAFPFTLILVPGQGPTALDTPLAEQGKLRADLAAQRYAAGVAPLVALSGGHVHPDRTPYAEALEMKRYLREVHGIPEEALLVDPHARHTTTNLRNVTRLLLRAGVPADRPLLVTSDLGQMLYIGYWHGTFGPRCEEELGYLPWRSLVPLSTNDACMRPTAVSLHADGRDPLDP
jgi:hypothetical protein